MPPPRRPSLLLAATATAFLLCLSGTAVADEEAPSDPAVSEVAPARAPSAPAAVTVTPVAGAVDAVAVSWDGTPDDGGSPVLDQDVTVQDAAATTVGAEARSVTLTGLTQDAPLTVRITVRTAAGRSEAASVAVPRLGLPTAPLAVTASAGSGRATVTWQAPVEEPDRPVVGYVVTTLPSGARSDVLPADARALDVAGLADGTPVTFTVSARTWSGEGPASEPSGPVVPRQPAVLTVLAAPAARTVHGSASTVRAALRRADGSGVPGAQLLLLAGGATVATATTDATGQADLRAVLAGTSDLVVRASDGALEVADVAVARVQVAWRVSRSAPRSTKVGTTVTTTGSVSPARPVGSAVRLQRQTSSGWRDVATGRMVSATSYRVAWRSTAVGAVTLRTSVPADSRHVTGTSAPGRLDVIALTARDLAQSIRGTGRIALAEAHAAGRADRATARAVIDQLSAGLLARRSSYGNAPGGSTSVSLRLLGALQRMGQRGSVSVSEISGGSHVRTSKHYAGKGLDINVVNGRHVGRGSSYGMAVEACRAFGASVVYSPASDPDGSHHNHVHCEWA